MNSQQAKNSSFFLKLFLSLFLLPFCFLITSAQQVSVRGKVLDKFGEPIPGAGIMISGTTQGTVSDMNGDYIIPASVGSILEISSLGLRR